MILILLLIGLAHADGDCPRRYEVEGGKVYFIDGDKKQIVPRATVDSFAALPPVKNCSENVYARDQYFAYLNGKVIDDAEVKGFFVETVDDRYTHDEKHAYWKGKEIKQATGKGFRAVAVGYARDVKRVFFENLEVPEADPQHLSSAGNGFVRDENRVFFETEAFPLAQLHLYGSYARLGPKVFYHRAVLAGADAETFTALDDCFARDAKSAWVRASRWTDIKADALTALEPNSPYREACRNKEAEICCARKGANLVAVVREKKGESRTIDLPSSEIQVLPDGILKTKTWTFKNLIEQ